VPQKYILSKKNKKIEGIFNRQFCAVFGAGEVVIEQPALPVKIRAQDSSY
jgi:hypothetical protein